MNPIIYIVTYNVGLSVAPIVLWTVPFIVTGFFFIRSCKYRNSIASTSMIALLFGVAASSVIVAAVVQALTFDTFSVSIGYPPYHFFNGLYIAFPFVPALIAFYKLEKQAKTSAIGKCAIYLGFFWVVVVFATALTCTILSGIMVKAYDDGEMDDAREKFVMFGYASLVLSYIGWGFILFQLILTFIYHEKVPHGTATRALYAYTAITTLQQTLDTIFITANMGLTDESISTLIYLCLFLVEVPTIISILIMFFTGHLWVNQMGPSAILDDQSKLEQQASLKDDQDNKMHFFSDFLRIISFS